MHIRATCDACRRDFLFFQLYNADLWYADKCPHCHVDLGVTNLRQLALAADRALAGLVNVMEQIAERSPGFSVKPNSLLHRLEQAAAALAKDGDSPNPAHQRPLGSPQQRVA